MFASSSDLPHNSLYNHFGDRILSSYGPYVAIHQRQHECQTHQLQAAENFTTLWNVDINNDVPSLTYLLNWSSSPAARI